MPVTQKSKSPKSLREIHPPLDEAIRQREELANEDAITAEILRLRPQDASPPGMSEKQKGFSRKWRHYCAPLSPSHHRHPAKQWRNLNTSATCLQRQSPAKAESGRRKPTGPPTCCIRLSLTSTAADSVRFSTPQKPLSPRSATKKVTSDRSIWTWHTAAVISPASNGPQRRNCLAPHGLRGWQTCGETTRIELSNQTIFAQPGRSGRGFS